jgi:hypothetical protein
MDKAKQELADLLAEAAKKAKAEEAAEKAAAEGSSGEAAAAEASSSSKEGEQQQEGSSEEAKELQVGGGRKSKFSLLQYGWRFRALRCISIELVVHTLSRFCVTATCVHARDMSRLRAGFRDVVFIASRIHVRICARFGLMSYDCFLVELFLLLCLGDEGGGRCCQREEGS